MKETKCCEEFAVFSSNHHIPSQGVQMPKAGRVEWRFCPWCGKKLITLIKKGG